jgi:hypothetical protein
MSNEKLIRVALRYQGLFLDVKRENVNTQSSTNENVIAFVARLAQNGYSVSEELLHALTQVSVSDLNQITNIIDDVFGVNLNWTPLVKNWKVPTGESLADHLITLIVNVLGGEETGIPGTKLPCGHFIPEGTFPIERYNGCPFCGRPFITSNFVYKGQGSKLRELRLFTEDDMRRTLVSLLESPVPLDATQMDSLNSLLIVYGVPADVTVGMKETLVAVVKMLIGEDCADDAAPLFKSPVDIMRYLWFCKTGNYQIIEPKILIRNARLSSTHMWRRASRGEEAAEKKKTELKLKFTRPECHMVAVWMNSLKMSAAACCELMNPKREMWVRFIRSLRLGEYSRKKGFSHLAEILDVFYRKDYVTWQSRLDAAEKENNASKVLSILQERPGSFARSLFSTMLKYGSDRTLDAFSEVSDKMPARLFVSLENAADTYFDTKQKQRVVKPITNISKVVDKNRLVFEKTDDEIKSMLYGIGRLYGRSMRKRFAAVQTESKTMFIDETLMSIPLAVGDRATTVQDASCALMGTRFKMEGDHLRLFLQWGKGLPAQHLDMDLSCRVSYPDRYDECAYFNLTCNGCKHSGDIREIPDQVGTAEYIEIDVPMLATLGAKYVMFTCNAYSNGNLSPNLVVGWMDSKNPMTISEETGVAYDPSCVQHMVRIKENDLSKGLVFGVLDVVKREVIWLEMPFTAQTIQGKSSEDVELFLERLSKKMTVGELLKIKAEAQGIEIIDNADEADEKYTYEWALQPEEVSKLLNV